MRERVLEREKAGEADCDEREDLGAVGAAGTALDENVILQEFVEEQLQA